MSLRTFTVLVFVAAMMPVVGAAPSNKGTGAAHAANFDAALAQAHAGNLSAAEAALFRDNVQRQNTLAYDVECATKLVQLAAVLQQTYDYQNANTALQLAISTLDATSAAHQSDTPAIDRAQADELRGFVCDRYLHDPDSATAAFQRAQQLNPNSAAASDGLAKINSDKATKNRAIGGGNG